MKRYELDNYKSEIINLYINKNMPCSKIANEINSSLSGIYDALKRWGIKTRSLSDSTYILNIVCLIAQLKLRRLLVEQKNLEWIV